MGEGANKVPQGFWRFFWGGGDCMGYLGENAFRSDRTLNSAEFITNYLHPPVKQERLLLVPEVSNHNRQLCTDPKF